MDLFLMERKGDLESVRESYKTFTQYDNDELLAAYNSQAGIGIVGVHKQGLHILGLHHVFTERFGRSPIIADRGIIRLTGHLHSLEELESKPYSVRLVLREGKQVHKRFRKKLILTEPQVSLKPHLETSADGLILEKGHSHMHTQIHLLGVAPYALLKFDENNRFESADFNADAQKVFSVQTTSQTILIIKLPNEILARKMESIQLLNTV